MASPQKENGYTAIANEIMEALAKIRIPGEARQMLDVIIRKTYGYHKKSDPIATSQFIEFTGLKRSIIHRARKRLLLSNLIAVYKNDNSQVLSYSFQKDYNKWIPYTKKIAVYKNATDCIQKSAQTVSIIEAHKRNKDIYTKDIALVFETWNDRMPMKITTLTGKRRDHLITSHKEPIFVDSFNTILDKILESDFLMGKVKSQGHNNFKANFDWIIKNDLNYVKIIEGNYDGDKKDIT